MNLTDFAAKTKCPICDIPEQAEIEEALAKRTATPSQVARWLNEEKGYPLINYPKISNHFQYHRDHS